MKKFKCLIIAILFSSIAWSQTADKSQDETITGKWNFNTNNGETRLSLNSSVNQHSRLWVNVGSANKFGMISYAVAGHQKWQHGYGANYGNGGFYLYNTTISKYAFVVNSTNNHIGIGTTDSTGSHRLAVEGSIGAREIKVEANSWSDFVFFDNYNLPTLNQVENFINENGHLKDIPSAKEVKENGIYLGEMNSKLLQKIEELTLYTIAQEKKIKELNDLSNMHL
jgi:hypothetical protein